MRREVRRFSLTLIACFALSAIIAACAYALTISNPAPAFPRIKTYTTSQTIVCPPTATWAQTELWGPSGPGGGGGTSTGGGGGGGGGYAKCLFLCSGGSLSLTIGTLGTPGVAGSTCSSGAIGSATFVAQGGVSCGAGTGATGTAACGGGAGGGAVQIGAGNLISITVGATGAAGSGATGGAGGQSALSGGAGGNSGQNGAAGQSGLAIFTFF